MYPLFKLPFISALALLLTSCSAELQDYHPEKGQFDLQSYFNGKLTARGMIQDHTDKVTRRFCVELEGTWQGNQGVLAETFYYDDGEVGYRDWQLTKQQDGHYIGLADDVIGEAVGEHQGFAFQLRYTLALKVNVSVYEVAMDDWMYQLDPYRVMNKTAINKLGVNVAHVTLFFDKQSTVTTCQ